MGIPIKTTLQSIEQPTEHPLKNNDGTYTQNTKQTLERWTQWIKEQFQISPEKEIPEIDHIAEKEWGKWEKQDKRHPQTKLTP